MWVVGIINDFPSLVKAEKGDGRLVGGTVSGVPPEKKMEHVCQLRCCSGWPVRHYYRGLSPVTVLRRLCRDLGS